MDILPRIHGTLNVPVLPYKTRLSERLSPGPHVPGEAGDWQSFGSADYLVLIQTTGLVQMMPSLLKAITR